MLTKVFGGNIITKLVTPILFFLMVKLVMNGYVMYFE